MIAEITNHPLRLQGFDVAGIASGANQQPKIGALLGQNAGHMTANKSGSASDKGKHLAIGTWHLAITLFGNQMPSANCQVLLQRLWLQRNIAFTRRLLRPILAYPGLPTVACGHVAAGKGEGCNVGIADRNLSASILREQ